ncbi:MAG: lantibiotic dehydratase, partial [Pseudonocardiaceae bacterium]
SVSGLGWPRGYPDGPEPITRHVFSDRDRLLFALAAEATAHGAREVELTDATVDALAAAGGDPEAVPPHIDMGARIHALNREALQRGEYTFTVAVGRAAGTLSSRFSALFPELGGVFADLPTTVTGAASAQLSFPPMFPSAENVARVPAYLPDTVSVGEHPNCEVIGVDDLALTAARQRLHLVSLSRGQVVEPVVLHALAPKQQPPLARLVGEVSRALDSGWVGFDWGAAEALPFRPRVRYGRAILCAARWRLSRVNLSTDAAAWDRELENWRKTWRCPSRVELRDFDQLLPLDLDIPVHREVLYRHLRANDDAVLVEAPEPDADGWINGHAHTVVFPLVSQREQAPGPIVDALPILERDHGHVPGSTGTGWLYAKAYVPAQHMDTFLTGELPALLADLGDRACWFVRWPQAIDGDDADHLRIRVRINHDPDKAVAVVAAWADRLRAVGRLDRLAFDTYYPETGRYLAIDEAETVFAADSRFVLALLTHAHGRELAPEAVAAVSLFDVAAGFLGGHDQAAAWLTRQAITAAPERAHVEQVTRLARGGMWQDIPDWPEISSAHQERADALAAYRAALPDGADTDAVARSLLHMHHNRLLGVDREREAACLRLARQAVATWRATRAGRA